MNRALCLTDLTPGQRCRVCSLAAQGTMRRRLLDLGFVEDTKVECVLCSPSGDPKAYLVRGAVIALRRQDSDSVLVEPL